MTDATLPSTDAPVQTNGANGTDRPNVRDGGNGTNGARPGSGSSNGAASTNGDGSAQRRTELADFLRSRRERIAPEDVGMAPGRRRRTPGLRREEVAQIAGVGVTWYTWLEQGRPINASAQVLDAVARALRLDRAERAHLHRLADLRPPDCDGESQLPPELQTILDGLDPIPAGVYNSRYDVLAWNRTFGALFPRLVAAAPVERNVLWQLFTARNCCNQFVNPDAELPAMVATLRGHFARHVGEPAWTDFVRRLSAASPEFAAMWATHDVAGPRQHDKSYRHAAVGEIHLTATTLNVALAPDARVNVLTPRDEPTKAKIAYLLAHPDLPSCAAHP